MEISNDDLARILGRMEAKLDAQSVGLASLAIGMTVIRGLAEFVQERFPQHGSILVEILEPFGDVLPKILANAK